MLCLIVNDANNPESLQRWHVRLWRLRKTQAQGNPKSYRDEGLQISFVYS